MQKMMTRPSSCELSPVVRPLKRDASNVRSSRIVGVGQGETGPIVDVIGMRLTEIARRMRGKGGSVCRLQLLPKGRSDRTLVSMVERSSSKRCEAWSSSGQKPDGKPLRVGYLNVPGLYASRAATAQAETSTRDAQPPGRCGSRLSIRGCRHRDSGPADKRRWTRGRGDQPSGLVYRLWSGLRR